MMRAQKIPKKGKKLDLHYIITRIFNVHFTDFIKDHKVEAGKLIETKITGGLQDIKIREGAYDPFINYANWLNSFRNRLWHISQKHDFNFGRFREEMKPLIYFYENISRAKEEPLSKLTKSLEICFKDIDKYLKTSYFSDNIKESQRSYKTVVKVLNCLGLPVSAVKVIVSWINKLDAPTLVKEYPLKIETGPNGCAQVSLMKSNYKVCLEKYDKESSLTVPGDREVVVKVPEEFQVACPYCKRLFQIELSDKWSEVTCTNMDCSKKWHEGVFRVLLGRVVSKGRRRLGRNRRARWSIRLLTPQDQDFIEFASTSRFVLKQNDVLTVSHEKASKGIFKKKWTGGWDSRPKMLVNNTGREPIIIQSY